MKKTVSILLSLIMLTMSLAPAFTASAASYREKLKKEGFPESYIDSLVSLHKKYPEWEFKAFKTGVSFSSAVSGERSSHSKQIIENSYSSKYFCSCSNCKKNGKYVYRYSGCYAASDWAVKHFMDPRNWLDEKHIFQFESNKYSSSHTQKGVESIIKNTWMNNAQIRYVNTSGKKVYYTDSSGKKLKYSKAIMQVAKAENVSAYYLASRIVKEVGATTPKVSGTCGTKKPFTGIYNYYSIGATSGGMSGLEWASGFLLANKKTVMYSKYDSKTGKCSGKKTKIKSGQRMVYIGTYGKKYKVKLYSGTYTTNGAVGYVNKSVLRTTYFNYSRPWTSPYKSIKGGAEYLSDKYLTYQYTTYLEKFNLNKSSGSLYNHEYMQNVDAPSHEAVSKYNAYNNAGQLSKKKIFNIPVFTSMPGDSKKKTKPDTKTDDNKKTSSSVVKNLKVKGTSITSITLKWKKVSNADKYYICVNNLTKGTTFGKTVTENKGKLNGLTKGNVYSIKVRAYRNGKWQKYSKTVKARCKPPKQKIKSLSSPGRGLIKTVWKKKKGVDGYQLVYSRDKEFKNVVARRNIKASASSYTGRNFTKGVTYYIKVRSYIKFNGKKYYGKYSDVKTVKSK